MDFDWEEDVLDLRKAVAAYKRNMKHGMGLLNHGSGSSKGEMRAVQRNKSTSSPKKIIGNPGKINLLEKLNTSASSDLQDLMKHFIQAKKSDKAKPEKQRSDYEREGAIPKRKILNPSDEQRAGSPRNSKMDFLNENGVKSKIKSKLNGREVNKTDSSFNVNGRAEHVMLPTEKICSKPFFYIVPEHPAPDFLFPRGSYYVIPKNPDSSSPETIIIHPDDTGQTNKTGSGSPLICDWETRAEDLSGAKDQTRKSNDLGKEEPQRVDSHLNIGPIQVKEALTTDNLESSCNCEKSYNKNIKLSLERSHQGSEDEEDVLSSQEKELNVERNWHCVSPEEDPTEEALRLERLDSTQQRLMSEFPDIHSDSAKLIAEDYLQEERLEGVIDQLRAERKLEEQFERMVKALPESRPMDLMEKCLEFQGEEERVSAYIEEVQVNNKLKRLVTEMLLVLPDADPSFLLEKIKAQSDYVEDVNGLIYELLESQNYPKIDEVPASKRKLWQTYVKNFQVNSFLLNVPQPEDFGGPAGNNNKADEKLIMQFLKTRYPDLTEVTLASRFNSNNRNLTKTCASLNEYEAVRLSESNFEFENFTEGFMQEICYIDHREEIDEHLKILKESREIEAAEARLEGAFLVCPLCDNDELIASEAVTCAEGDVFCRACIKRYVEVKISDGVYTFACPEEKCDSFFTMQTLEHFLPETISSIVMQKQQAEEITKAKVDGLEFCSFCDFACIPNPNDKVFKCLNLACLAEICRKCGEKSHIPIRCEEIERPADLKARKKIEEAMTEKLIRKCPTCQRPLLKIDGCNKILCTCGTMLCYFCRKEIQGYSHFQSHGGTCPLYSANTLLHETEVVQAGVRVRDEVLQEDPNIRIHYDPTENFS